MRPILRHGAQLQITAILVLAFMISFAHGETIEFSWTSEGAFYGTPSAGTVDTAFSSSAPFNLATFHSNYTGEGGATRVYGPFEISAPNADKLFGNYDIRHPGPIGLGMNFSSGAFYITGGTGQFSGATGQGTLDVITTLPTYPTTSGPVEQDWRGSVTLALVPVPGDYNRNGSVDAPDYVVWRKTLGQTGAGLAADGDDDNQVGSGDYDIWRANFGQTAGSDAALPSAETLPAAVPESATLALGSFALASWLVFSRRRTHVQIACTSWLCPRDHARRNVRTCPFSESLVIHGSTRSRRVIPVAHTKRERSYKR
jgi:hypothetical protein